jgi:hypothetical protein
MKLLFQNTRTTIAVTRKSGTISTGNLKDNKVMTGIQFLTDEKGRKVAVQIDLKTHGTMWEDFRDGMVAESRRKEKSVPYGQYREKRLKTPAPRG